MSCQKPTCKHHICDALWESGHSYKRGVSIVVHDGDNIIIGETGLGRMYGKYTTCAGKHSADDGCCMETAVRELREEFKITETYDQHHHSRFEACATIGEHIVMLFNCTGLDYGMMKAKVRSDYQRALSVVGIYTVEECKNLRYCRNEPREVTEATTNGELKDIYYIPYGDLPRYRGRYRDFCEEHVDVMMSHVHHMSSRYTPITTAYRGMSRYDDRIVTFAWTGTQY